MSGMKRGCWRYRQLTESISEEAMSLFEQPRHFLQVATKILRMDATPPESWIIDQLLCVEADDGADVLAHVCRIKVGAVMTGFGCEYDGGVGCDYVLEAFLCRSELFLNLFMLCDVYGDPSHTDGSVSVNDGDGFHNDWERAAVFPACGVLLVG